MTDNSLNRSLRPNPNSDWPTVDPTAYIDPSAQVIGNVYIKAQVYVGPNAVIRADESDDDGKVRSVTIGPQCNVQDGVIIHALGGTQVTIGRRTSLAHGCIIHGPCTIGQNCFIGFRAVVYKAALGNNAFINAGAVVQGVDLAENTLVPAAAAILSIRNAEKLTSEIGPAENEFAEKVVSANLNLTKGYILLAKQAQNGFVEKKRDTYIIR